MSEQPTFHTVTSINLIKHQRAEWWFQSADEAMDKFAAEVIENPNNFVDASTIVRNGQGEMRTITLASYS